MKSIVIIDVPDYAECYKFLVVEFIDDFTRKYVTGFLEEKDALEYFHDHENDNLSIVYRQVA